MGNKIIQRCTFLFVSNHYIPYKKKIKYCGSYRNNCYYKYSHMIKNHI